jgi:GNAT superfamily N-acetyltransferase
MLAWCEDRARRSIHKAPDEARVMLVANIFSADRRAARAHQKQGFNLVRHSLRMVIELDGEIPEPEWPAGIRLKPFVLGEDDEITVRADRESFADHWGYVERPFEDDLARFRHFWQTDEDFDPSLNYLAMDGAELAGISLCLPKVEEDPDMGWVGTLGVRRPWRRKGLGLALLLHSFREFKRRGKARVGLGVDAESLTGATRLYEKAGMHPAPEWQWSIFEKELRQGIDLSTQKLDL